MKKKKSESLSVKLGLTSTLCAKAINEPEDYFELISGYHEGINFIKRLKEPIDFIHLFTKSKKELLIEFPNLIKYVNKEGNLWISWPHSDSSIVSDLTKAIILEIGSKHGMSYQRAIIFNKDWSAVNFIKNPDRIV